MTSPETPEETGWILGAAGGDRDAFASLVRLHEGAVWRAALHYLHDPEDAREAAQETFLRAWAALRTFGGRGSFRGWLLAIARGICLDRIRRERRAREARLALARSSVDGVAPRGEEGVLAGERRRALGLALSGLSARQRAALILTVVEGCSAREVGAALGCSSATARVTVFMARRKALRALVGEPGSPERGGEEVRNALLGH